MSRYLIIPDLHHKWKIAQQIIDAVKHDYVIFGGDFFDDFNDDVSITRVTALWVKESLTHENRIHLLGNHEMPYFLPCQWTFCSGYHPEKAKVINSVLTNEDWEKFSPFHYVEEGNWLISHAGVARELFEDPQRGFTIEVIAERCTQGIIALSSRQHSPYFAAGYSRGGSQYLGGINWQDFNELSPIKEFKQIVFHTPSWEEPQVKFANKDGRVFQRTYHRFNGWNTRPLAVNLDTRLRHYGVLEDGKLSIHETARIGLEKTKEMELL
jgi:Calcineurin-like phosphoesterase